jgi:hypothetical protein
MKEGSLFCFVCHIEISQTVRRTSCRAFGAAGKHSMSKKVAPSWFHNVSMPTVKKLLNIEQFFFFTKN